MHTAAVSYASHLSGSSTTFVVLAHIAHTSCAVRGWSHPAKPAIYLTTHPDHPPQIRARLHVVMCVSPVGDRLRGWARQFPALVSCATLDWFHPWPQEALVSGEERAGLVGDG